MSHEEDVLKLLLEDTDDLNFEIDPDDEEKLLEEEENNTKNESIKNKQESDTKKNDQCSNKISHQSPDSKRSNIFLNDDSINTPKRLKQDNINQKSPKTNKNLKYRKNEGRMIPNEFIRFNKNFAITIPPQPMDQQRRPLLFPFPSQQSPPSMNFFQPPNFFPPSHQLPPQFMNANHNLASFIPNPAPFMPDPFNPPPLPSHLRIPLNFNGCFGPGPPQSNNPTNYFAPSNRPPFNSDYHFAPDFPPNFRQPIPNTHTNPCLDSNSDRFPMNSNMPVANRALLPFPNRPIDFFSDNPNLTVVNCDKQGTSVHNDKRSLNNKNVKNSNFDKKNKELYKSSPFSKKPVKGENFMKKNNENQSLTIKSSEKHQSESKIDHINEKVNEIKNTFGIDEEYMQKLEEQKKLREKIAQEKEQKRKYFSTVISSGDNTNSKPSTNIINKISPISKSTNAKPSIKNVKQTYSNPSSNALKTSLVQTKTSGLNQNPTKKKSETVEKSSATIKISGLTPEIRESSLRKLARPFGMVEMINFTDDRRCAMLKFTRITDAQKFMNHSKKNGQTLVFDERCSIHVDISFDWFVLL